LLDLPKNAFEIFDDLADLAFDDLSELTKSPLEPFDLADLL